MRERAAKAVARSGATGATRCVTVAIHHSSVPRGPRRPLVTALSAGAPHERAFLVRQRYSSERHFVRARPRDIDGSG
jgi:hypothetical protein